MTMQLRKLAAKGHTVYAGRFEDVDIPEGQFDFVWASHVIEHVPDPKAFTEKVFRLLKPGGIFWFWTPNIESLDARIFRNKHWGAYHFPRHWVFYDEKSVNKLGRKLLIRSGKNCLRAERDFLGLDVPFDVEKQSAALKFCRYVFSTNRLGQNKCSKLDS